MNSASEIVEYVGAGALAEAVGTSVKNVRQAARKGVLPSAWYDACERLAGRPLRRELFSFKRIPSDARAA